MLNLGIEHRPNVKLGQDFTLEDLQNEGFDAVFMGIGAWRDYQLRVEGEDLKAIDRLVDYGRAQVERLPQLGGRIDLAALMTMLAGRAVNEVLIESGPTLAGAALQAGLVDELILYQAAHLMGDAARALVSLHGVDFMQQRLGFAYDDARRVGEDLRLTLKPRID